MRGGEEGGGDSMVSPPQLHFTLKLYGLTICTMTAYPRYCYNEVDCSLVGYCLRYGVTVQLYIESLDLMWLSQLMCWCVWSASWKTMDLLERGEPAAPKSRIFCRG